jgi:hypothetical protein
MRITFSKGKAYEGRMRLPETFKIKVDGVVVGTLQKLERIPGLRVPDRVKCWFWYGDGVNTSQEPMSLEDCREHAKKYFRIKQEQHATKKRMPDVP